MSRGRVAAAAVAGLAAAGLATAGCSGSAGTASSQAAGGAHGAGAAAGSGAGVSGTAARPLAWRSCPQVARGLQCASLSVPVDYARPGGRHITLALSRMPATAPAGRRQGVLLVNPGGPGAPGRSLAAIVAAGLDPSVSSAYDIVGFDTRGAGASVPALHCDPSFFTAPRPDDVPASRAAERVLVGQARAYAADCERKYGWLLPHMRTPDLARDLDAIRVALGQRTINYLGYSYGTYLGQVYATMFPGRVRRMALDSTVNPAGVWLGDNLAQDYAFERRQRAFFAWAAGRDRQYHLGASAAAVSRSWQLARARLAARPAGPPGPRVGPDEFDRTFLAGGYDDQYWPELAGALSAYLGRGAGGAAARGAARGQGSAGALQRLYRQAGVQSENEFAVYSAVQCSDAAWPRNWATWDAAARKVYRRAPFQAWDNTWFNAACAFWPVRGPARTPRVGAAGLPGILMLQGSQDPATPYAGAKVARRQFPTARMVVVRGGGNHGQSLTVPANTCVNGYLNRYLASGRLPAGRGLVSATCPAIAPPGPAP